MNADSSQPGPEPRFRTLDALRGVAALSVLVLHADPACLPRAWLAVDLFFILSGFVIAHSYEAPLRDGRVSRLDFCKRRFVRLYPMILAGAAAGAVRIFYSVATQPDLRPLFGRMAGLFAMSLAMIPNIFFDETIGGAHPTRLTHVFPFDGVLWSLFFELAANAVYVVCVRRLTDRAALALVAVCAACLLTRGEPGGVFQDDFWGGFPRAGFGFFAGVLLWRGVRSGRLPALPLGAAPLTLVLMAVFLPSPAADALSRLSVFASLFLILPAVVACAAASEPSGPGARLAALLGALSYPLYALHRPLIEVIGAVAAKVAHAPSGSPAVLAAAVILPVALSYAALKLYDEPARRLLGRWLLATTRG